MPAPYLPILLTRSQDDTDAIAILNAITAAGVTPTTAMTNAAHYFVSASKWAGLWTKFTAAYLFIGGTAATHAINAKSPGTYGITGATWSSGVTHNANGITGNGSTGFGDTGLVPNSVLNINSNHLCIYSRTNAATTTCDIGAADNGNTNNLRIYSRYSDNSAYIALGTTSNTVKAVADSLGCYVISRTASNVGSFFKKGAKLLSISATPNGNTARSITLCKCNVDTSGDFSLRNLSFASIGSGLTDQNAKDLSLIVQSTQTILNRAV